MRKDGLPVTGGITGNPVSKLLLCFETKPLLATVLAFSLVMFIYNLQPYYDHLLHSSVTTHCNCSPLKTAILNDSSTVVTSSTTSAAAAILSLARRDTNETTTVSGNQHQHQDQLRDTNEKTVSVQQVQHQQKEVRTIRTAKAVPNKNKDKNKREFKQYGNAAALFVQMGAYRGGSNTFSVVGLASKPIHVYGKPWYKCEWVPNNGAGPVRAKAVKILPDWGYGRVYTVVVVNCTFPMGNPNVDNSGGKLVLYAYYSPSPRTFEKFTVLEELPGQYDVAKYGTTNGVLSAQRPEPELDYLYCGSSLYGNLSAARIREWMAYHAWLFGPKSHFVFHDAGGVSEEVRAVLEPWVKLGRATVQDIREQEKYDGYYYNQFLVVNDCLHRYRFDAKWTFFFDVDEYIYLPDGRDMKSVMREFDGFTQFTIEQNPMSSKLCLNDSTQDYSSQWGFEKLLFRDSRTRIRRDRKYAIQARNAFATGVHMSENIVGKSLHNTESKIRYYHYHNTIQVKGEPCRVFVPPSAKKSVTLFDKLPYVYDDNMTRLADTVKRFERQTLGTYQLSS